MNSNLSKSRKSKDGRYVFAQAMIPREIYEDVRARAKEEYGYMATYFRKWIIDGYNNAKSKGEF